MRLDLDDLERLARVIRKHNASVKFGHPKYIATVDSQSLLQLLDAIEAMLPVVRAAEAYVDARTISDADDTFKQLIRALDTMREARK